MTSDALFPKELLSHPLLASPPPNFFFWRGRVIKSSPTRLPFPKFLFLERLSWREVEDDGLKQVDSSFDDQHGPGTLQVTPPK